MRTIKIKRLTTTAKTLQRKDSQYKKDTHQIKIYYSTTERELRDKVTNNK